MLAGLCLADDHTPHRHVPQVSGREPIGRDHQRTHLHSLNLAVHSIGIDRMVEQDSGYFLGKQLLKLAVQGGSLLGACDNPGCLDDFADSAAVQPGIVLPNGDLAIEGNRVVTVNDDEETLFLSGIVRSRDISDDNTIYSHQIANAQISSKSKGTVNSGNRPGFITRLINWVF